MAWIVVVFCAATAISFAQTLTTLYSFCSQPNCVDGAYPQAGLVQGTDGNFYGTTANDAGPNQGTVFKVTAGGTLTSLYNFCAQTGCPDGSQPSGGLVQATDGDLYGTTVLGGASDYGTVFKITPGGTLTSLYSFCAAGFSCADGGYPHAGLVQATDGNFYGTTFQGGAYGGGTVFKITAAGTLTTLHSFGGFGTDGYAPFAGLVQATDGNFYGTTNLGGPRGYGTVFKITPGGMLTMLYSFCSQGLCPDGGVPEGGLVQATDGNFYGTTSLGGANCAPSGCGTVFKITAAGTLTTLHSFAGYPTDGAAPEAGLVQATDGNFYGIAQSGGVNCAGSSGCGTIFKISPNGTLTTLHSFDVTDGLYPVAALVQATNGNFYGTTPYGGANCTQNGGLGCGTVFSLSVGLTAFVETQPTSGRVGDPVIILGTNLTGVTDVAFNGTPATFNVVSPSEITTIVPAGATTGTVQVTGTPSGTLTSDATFEITSPVQFVSVTPCRLVDTRTQYGGKGPIQGGTFESFDLAQAAQNKGCADLSSAGAYSLNVTVVPPGRLGYLTIWPTGEVMPFVSTMNSPDGRVKANAAIVPSGSNRSAFLPAIRPMW